MKSILDRFDFNIDATKMDATAWTIFICAWLVVVGCAIGSVLAHRTRFTRRQRALWIWVILCVPLFGVLAYLPASMMKDGYSILKTTKKKESKRIDSGN